VPGRGSRETLDALMRFGGFPEPFLSASARTLRRWQKERFERFFREDVRDLEVVRDLGSLEDFGTLMNPLIVDGQVIGGVAHGIGNTFLERVVYADDGQILTGTLMDYLMPTAADVPRIDVDHLGTPSPLNPLGAKGAGQGGLIPVAAVLTAAVEDALRPFGVKLTHVPFTPSDLVEAIETGSAATERGPRS